MPSCGRDLASMTVNEVRDRLDQRCRLLVRSRRALSRHQHPGSARCPGVQVGAGRRQVSRADPVFDAGDDPPVRRGSPGCSRRSMRDSGRPLAVLRRAGSRHPGLGDSTRQREAYDWFASELRTGAPHCGGPPNITSARVPLSSNSNPSQGPCRQETRNLFDANESTRSLFSGQSV